MKSRVWSRRNHRFRFPSFAAKCLEKCSQVSVVLDTLSTKMRKRLRQNTSKNQRKIDCRKTQFCYGKVCLPFGFWAHFFNMFWTRMPLGTQTSKNPKKRFPKGLQNDPPKPKNHTGNQKNSHTNLHKQLHYILHLEKKSSEPVGTRPGGMRVAL